MNKLCDGDIQHLEKFEEEERQIAEQVKKQVLYFKLYFNKKLEIYF